LFRTFSSSTFATFTLARPASARTCRVQRGQYVVIWSGQSAVAGRARIRHHYRHGHAWLDMKASASDPATWRSLACELVHNGMHAISLFQKRRHVVSCNGRQQVLAVLPFIRPTFSHLLSLHTFIADLLILLTGCSLIIGCCKCLKAAPLQVLLEALLETKVNVNTN